MSLSEKQTQLVNRIAKDEGFGKFDLEVNSGALKGDGYLGTFSIVKISDKNSQRILNLVLKSAQINPEAQDMPVRSAFERENHMYQMIFPEFLKLQIKNGVEDKFNGHANFYGSCMDEDNETIALEDLRESGFKLWNIQEPMNDEHVELVFRQYAKFHALSFALKKIHREKYEELTKILTNVFIISDEDMSEMITNVFSQAYLTIDDDHLLDALARFEAEAKFFLQYETTTINENCVITHGDCWNHNLMFQYSEEKPSRVCFLDWQVARKASPVLDLSYFLCTCASKTVLNDYQKYLTIYHETLKKTLEDLGIIEDVYNFEMLQYEWKKFAKYGLYLAIMIIRVMLIESNSDDGSSDEEYKERITYITEFMFKNHFIH